MKLQKGKISIHWTLQVIGSLAYEANMKSYLLSGSGHFLDGAQGEIYPITPNPPHKPTLLADLYPPPTHLHPTPVSLPLPNIIHP